jgi:hypothetical protein
LTSAAASPFGIPWQTPELWHTANAVLSASIGKMNSAMLPALATAARIARRIESMDRVMDGLCAQTCPACKAICCRHATVWFDFKDVLFLHLIGAELPPGQAVTGSGPPCRYLTSEGCVLPRHCRPFICLWYLCPAQKSILKTVEPGVCDDLAVQLEALKHDRREIEDLVVEALMAP